MAEATANRPPPQPPTTYTLTLSEDEATVIRTLVGHTKGSGRYGTAAKEIFEALYAVGATSEHTMLPRDVYLNGIQLDG